MAFFSAKTFISGFAIILFGWWVNQSIIPTFAPHLIGTPVAGVVSVIASITLWIVIYVLFWRHDKDVREAMHG